MIKIKKIIAFISIFMLLFSGALWANSHNKKTQITGSLNMKIETGKVNNIINNSSSSRATINIGAVKKSTINGNVKFDKIKVNNVKNEINSSTNSLAKVNIGVIEKSTVKDMSMNIDVNGVKNSVYGGNNNRAVVDVGVVKNSNITGQSTFDISVKKDIENTVYGGSNNRAKVVVGGIDDGDDEEDNGKVNNIAEGYGSNDISGRFERNKLSSGEKRNNEIIMSMIENKKNTDDIESNIQNYNKNIKEGNVYFVNAAMDGPNSRPTIDPEESNKEMVNRKLTDAEKIYLLMIKKKYYVISNYDNERKLYKIYQAKKNELKKQWKKSYRRGTDKHFERIYNEYVILKMAHEIGLLDTIKKSIPMFNVTTVDGYYSTDKDRIKLLAHISKGDSLSYFFYRGALGRVIDDRKNDKLHIKNIKRSAVNLILSNPDVLSTIQVSAGLLAMYEAHTMFRYSPKVRKLLYAIAINNIVEGMANLKFIDIEKDKRNVIKYSIKKALIGMKVKNSDGKAANATLAIDVLSSFASPAFIKKLSFSKKPLTVDDMVRIIRMKGDVHLKGNSANAIRSVILAAISKIDTGTLGKISTGTSAIAIIAGNKNMTRKYNSMSNKNYSKFYNALVHKRFKELSKKDAKEAPYTH